MRRFISFCVLVRAGRLRRRAAAGASQIYPCRPCQAATASRSGVAGDRCEPLRIRGPGGGTTVYFGAGSALLGTPARTVLSAQAAWLRRHPEIVVRVEGYGDTGDTRDHSIAVGARRASEARDYLLLMGVPAAQVSTASWGKERGGLGRAVTILVR